MAKKDKTNVMRILDYNNIFYKVHSFGKEQRKVEMPIFKTLVTVAKSKAHYVFVIPIQNELDLKKAAKAVDEKSIEMIKEKELLPLTGYVHGGCSPIGMKKPFHTVIAKESEKYPAIIFSAGKVGMSVEMTLSDLNTVLEFQIADVTK